MKEEQKKKLQELICNLSEISAEIEYLAFENELPELELLMEKCEKDIERPAQVMISSIGL